MILHRTQQRVGTDPYLPGRTLGVGDARETSAGITDDWWQSGACRSSGIDMTADWDERSRLMTRDFYQWLDPDPPSIKKRKDICASCPVLDRCTDDIVSAPRSVQISGVQAGMTDRDLRRARATN